MQGLLISFVATNVTHSYLVVRHRGKHRPTLSERAVEDDISLGLYIAAHIIAGVGFAVFSFSYFFQTLASPLTFGFAIIGVLTQWLQAVIPAKGTYEAAHTTLAYAMSLSMVAVGMTAIGSLVLPHNTRVELIILESIIVAGYPLARILPRQYFWIIQMVNINLFYLQMFILIAR